MTNADCTLYIYSADTEGYDRFFIPSVYWHENKSGNVLKSGLQSVHSTTVFFFDGSHLPVNPGKDLIVKGNCPFALRGDQKTVSENLARAKRSYRFLTVMSVDDCYYGSLPHYEITAK